MARQLLLAFAILGLCNGAFAGNIEKAKELFVSYRALETAFDSSLADLYSDEAVIKNRRIYPTGQIRELTFPAPQFKSLIRTAMPLAKIKGDYNTYSNISFSEEGKNVRIDATRYSVLKKYSSPTHLVVGPDEKGRWLILEEFIESRP